MKKVAKYFGYTVLGLTVISSGAFFWFLKNYKPANEERANYRREDIIKNIDEQLKDINIEYVKEKAVFIEQKTAEEIQGAIRAKKLSYEELVAFYLIRIRDIDHSEQGYNAVSEINSTALWEAKQKDAEFALNEELANGLYGLPFLVKENINTAIMPTSAGTYALKDFIVGENAPVVESLINNGAILLGKTNLSEMAHFMDYKMPSGYSSKNGQTHNPFGVLNISPLGSSSGSAVSMAVDLSTFALGTETTGSIVAPAAITSIVGFKPTKNIVSTDGVIPLSATLDTVGPMTKYVRDAVLLFNGSVTEDKVLDLPQDVDYLNRKRIGVLLPKDKQLAEQLQKIFAGLGSEVIVVNFDESDLDNLEIMTQDLGPNFATYAKTYNAPVKTIQELVENNKEDGKRRAKYGQRLLLKAANAKGRDERMINNIVATAKTRLEKIFVEERLDGIVFLNNDGSVLTCVAGAPAITVPFGLDKQGIPQGATFIQLANNEQKLVELAYAFEQKTKLRQLPKIS